MRAKFRFGSFVTRMEKNAKTLGLFKHFLIIFVLGSFISERTHATIIRGEVTGGDAFNKGGVFEEIAPPITVGKNNFRSNNLFGFEEQQDFALAGALTVDDFAVGGAGTGVGTIAAGTAVDSHYVFFDPGREKTLVGEVEFSSDILGLITTREHLNNSDFLGSPVTAYLNPGFRGLESVDVAIINNRKIEIDLRASAPGDYIRVITQADPLNPVPEPSTLVLVVLGTGAILFRRGRKTS